MEQLKILSEKENSSREPIKACVFTGHRSLEKDFSPRKLKKAIKNLLEKGVDTFFNGMAMGFDLLAAEYVLGFKKQYPALRLIACVPCYGQEKYFSETDQKRYAKVLSKADETVILSERYFKGCMQKRDRYMADRADVMISYCCKSEGGTAYTVNYFKKIRPEGEILFI